MIDPVLYDFGDFQIRWYSVLILVAVFVAYKFMASESKKQHIKTEFMFNLLFWALIFGILGARLYYVLFNFNLYKDNLSEIYKIWNGGLAIHGGLIAGLITVLLYCRKYKVFIIVIVFKPHLILHL